jgi:predicted dehydrogenase
MSCRAAILGTGNMCKRHAEGLKDFEIPITAVCGSSQQKTEIFARENDIKGAGLFGDFDTMLEKDNFDVLIICIPPFAQTGQFEKAAAKGKHIFIEKPIAIRSSVGVNMVHAAQQSGIITMVGFHMRKGAAIRRLEELVKEGKTGKAVLFNAQYQCNSLHNSWWMYADRCGGQIFEQAIHIYDLCRHFFGDPKSVSGIMSNVCHNHIHNYTIEDVSACIAGFTTGALASITANNCSVPNKWVGKITATFEKLIAEFDDHNHGVITFTSEPDIRTEIIKSELNPYIEEVKEFVECVQNGRQTSCGILEGYKSLCFVETVLHSAKLDGVKLSYEAQY